MLDRRWRLADKPRERLQIGLPSDRGCLFGGKPPHSTQGISIRFVSCSDFPLENPSRLLGPPIFKHSLARRKNAALLPMVLGDAPDVQAVETSHGRRRSPASACYGTCNAPISRSTFSERMRASPTRIASAPARRTLAASSGVWMPLSLTFTMSEGTCGRSRSV